MARLFSKTTQMVLDLVLLAMCLGVAFLLRFEGDLPLQMLKRALFIWPYVITIQYALLVVHDVPRFSWRYIGLREVSRIFSALGTAFLALLTVRLITAEIMAYWGYAQYLLIPIGVLLIDFTLAFLAITGIRVLRRMQTENAEREERVREGIEEIPTMLIGAGQAGLIVAKELTTRPDLGMKPVGFIDDDARKIGTVVHGVPVLGTTTHLAQLCADHGAKQVLITIANAPGSEIRRIKQMCDDAKLTTKIIPGVYEIVGGQVNLSRIRSVTIEDLLGRESVVLEMDAISAQLAGKTVLVTGAGGSIGSEICRQIARFKPGKLILLEQAENSLFNIHRELVGSFPELKDALIPCIADICDPDRIQSVFQKLKPEAVYHAAAHKHVPMMEWNPSEAVRNNVFGTRILADVAHATGVSHFVMISTDKAVNPTSVMGVSKRTAELYIQALAAHSKTRFVAVRFGNVLGSAGSVIPIFQEQIARGGPVMVTHPEMKRYFMTIPEACQLVLQTGCMGDGGEIFVLDMGEPVKIVDLARDLIRLSGFRPGQDIEIAFSGMRPGEKLFEELSVADAVVDRTRHPKIFVNREAARDFAQVTAAIDSLEPLLASDDAAVVRQRFRDLVPEYTPMVPGASEPVAASAVADGAASGRSASTSSGSATGAGGVDARSSDASSSSVPGRSVALAR